MSLIYGLKTQHGVYLAADTRLTTTLKSGLVKFEDDFGKFHSFGPKMHAVVAGDASLASYLLQKIQESNIGNSHYGIFRKKISSVIKEEIGFYPYINTAKNVVFIFAGCDPRKKEVVNMDKVVEYTTLMQGNTTNPVPVNIGKDLRKAMERAARTGKKGKKLKLKSAYKGLFSLEITINNGVDIKIKDAEWATYLMYGPKNLTAQNASPQLVIDIDLGSKPKGYKGVDILRDSWVKLTKYILSELVPKHQLHTVGGSVIVFLVTERGALFPTGEIAMQKHDGTIIRNITNVFVNNDVISTKVGGVVKPIRYVFKYFNSDHEISSASI